MRYKKGDLTITVNAIVIIVLALTFLSLGLVFIRQIFQGISDTTLTVQDQIRQQILDDLRRGDKKLSFPADEITVARGGEKIIGIGVKNILDSSSDFKVHIFDNEGVELVSSSQALDNVPVFYWDESAQPLAVNEVGVVGIKVLGPNTFVGSTISKIVISYSDESATDLTYSTKSFFVKVTG